jgi:hypothetical protein
MAEPPCVPEVAWGVPRVRQLAAHVLQGELDRRHADELEVPTRGYCPEQLTS